MSARVTQRWIGERKKGGGERTRKEVWDSPKKYISTPQKKYINTFFARKMTLRKVFMDVAK